MHKHILVTATVKEAPTDPHVIEDFLARLVSLVDMEIFMPPKAKYCYDPLNSGVTGTVVITTSHASIHIWDNVPQNPYPGMLQFDLYSCKDFEPETVLEFIQQYFGATIHDYLVIDRGLQSFAASAASEKAA